ncbi:unnamed protein product [Acanthosepion pharaonis]|uniref:Uncharacterized protein n=1 Tax=Acanthosepion pharaonis TaxID=158019 RepID=A0A812DEP2_ACAPH|nr:unnamed protein product [Sepia pharaonis]
MRHMTFTGGGRMLLDESEPPRHLCKDANGFFRMSRFIRVRSNSPAQPRDLSLTRWRRYRRYWRLRRRACRQGAALLQLALPATQHRWHDPQPRHRLALELLRTDASSYCHHTPPAPQRLSSVSVKPRDDHMPRSRLSSSTTTTRRRPQSAKLRRDHGPNVSDDGHLMADLRQQSHALPDKWGADRSVDLFRLEIWSVCRDGLQGVDRFLYGVMMIADEQTIGIDMVGILQIAENAMVEIANHFFPSKNCR